MEDRIIYAKYSDDRNSSFRIKTAIIDRDGKRIVRKYAMNETAIEHINNIHKHGILMENYFKKSKFDVLKSNVCKNYFEYEYVDGITLEEKLIKLLREGNKHCIKNFLKNFYDELLKLETTEHLQSEDFKLVFGDVLFDKPQESLLVSNIDLNFNNIILQDNRWMVIDYEWTFQFTIPINFIIFRILLNYSELFNQEYFDIFDISAQEIQLFHRMEEGFLRYIGYNSVVGDFGCQKILDVSYMLDKNKELEGKVLTLQSTIEQYESATEQYKSTIEQYENAAEQYKSTIEQYRSTINQYKSLVSDFENSNSWKLTAPLRKLSKIIK